jgi:prolyl-tRNA synthetase
MVRAGLIARTAPGIFSLLPLGRRSLAKLAALLRHELEELGASEVVLPSVLPAELWQESGRWQTAGPELLRVADRHGRDMCLAPGHIEAAIDVVRPLVTSYRQLPVQLFSIQAAFEDVDRPRLGLARARESLDLGAYSFHATGDDLERASGAMEAALGRVLQRSGIGCMWFEAEPEASEATSSHGVLAIADGGEDTVISCAGCGYGASPAQARAGPRPAPPPWARAVPAEPEAVHTPGMCTVDDVAGFLSVAPSHLVKTLLFAAGDTVVAALVRGDVEASEAKLARAVGCERLELVSAGQIEQLTGGPQGFSGPVGLSGVRLIADPEVMALEAAVTGANRADTHLVGVVPSRDIAPDEVRDVSQAQRGDPCPHCGQSLAVVHGIELGRVSDLGTDPCEKTGCTFLDDQGRQRPMSMGCSRLALGRTLAAAVEQHHDEHGIVWPLELAPFEVVLVLLNSDRDEVVAAANGLSARLVEAGVDVLYDDRSERPGIKFNDMDLIGFPVRVVVGKRGLASGEVELSLRRDRERVMVPITDIVERVRAAVDGLRA